MPHESAESSAPRCQIPENPCTTAATETISRQIREEMVSQGRGEIQRTLTA